jgi:hypothetical protein
MCSIGRAGGPLGKATVQAVGYDAHEKAIGVKAKKGARLRSGIGGG